MRNSCRLAIAYTPVSAHTIESRRRRRANTKSMQLMYHTACTLLVDGTAHQQRACGVVHQLHALGICPSAAATLDRVGAHGRVCDGEPAAVPHSWIECVRG